MFNLIMRSFDWATGRESLPLDRVFEYTEEYVAVQFQQGGNLILDRLMTLPCLFMEEGRGDEIAYIGQINRARVAGGTVSFEFALTPRFPHYGTA